MEDDIIEHDDFLSDDTLSDDSFTISELGETSPNSIAIDISNGSPINKDDFLLVHYNINSITAEGRLDELTNVVTTLNSTFSSEKFLKTNFGLQVNQ